MIGELDCWLKFRVLIAIVTKQGITGGWNVVLKLATKSIDDLVFQWVRDIGATLCCLLALTILTRKSPFLSAPKLRDMGLFIVYGSLNTYFAEYCMLKASDASYPMLTSTWLNFEPVFVTILSLLTGVEVLNLNQTDSQKSCSWNALRMPGVWKLVGTGLAVSGSMVYVYLSLIWDKNGGKEAGETYNLAAAHLYMFLEVSGAAAYHVLEKQILRRGYGAIETQCWGYCCGTVLITLVAAPQVGPHQLADLGKATNWLFIGYGVIGLSWIGATLLTWANKKSGPIFVSAFRPLQSVITALFMWVFYGRALNASVGVAAVIIVPGIYCLVWARNLETKGLEFNGDDDRLAGGEVKMRLAFAEEELLRVKGEIRLLTQDAAKQSGMVDYGTGGGEGFGDSSASLL